MVYAALGSMNPLVILFINLTHLHKQVLLYVTGLNHKAKRLLGQIKPAAHIPKLTYSYANKSFNYNYINYTQDNKPPNHIFKTHWGISLATMSRVPISKARSKTIRPR